MSSLQTVGAFDSRIRVLRARKQRGFYVLPSYIIRQVQPSAPQQYQSRIYVNNIDKVICHANDKGLLVQNYSRSLLYTVPYPFDQFVGAFVANDRLIVVGNNTTYSYVVFRSFRCTWPVEFEDYVVQHFTDYSPAFLIYVPGRNEVYSYHVENVDVGVFKLVWNVYRYGSFELLSAGNEYQFNAGANFQSLVYDGNVEGDLVTLLFNVGYIEHDLSTGAVTYNSNTVWGNQVTYAIPRFIGNRVVLTITQVVVPDSRG